MYLRSSGWREKVVWRMHDALPLLNETGTVHKFAPITPPDYDSDLIYPLPSVVFRMFDYTDVMNLDDDEDVEGTLANVKSTPILPGAHTIERFLIDEELSILMETLNFNRVMWWVPYLFILI
ncbi:unnamed protein product [Protopolystoma xenopodis]|uniref:Uncharacterized protein n=1 Tax=Protopolystoma xenopodis TaxID=117903 RepID=A0A448XRC5_9PLAT|nr:unnamed protein product [Protopolystoma xenopodis]